MKGNQQRRGATEYPLDIVQSWFQSVITNADGVEPGIRSPDSQKLIGHSEAEKVIRRSQKLGSVERLGIYANAYFARLLECMGSYFPVLKKTLGAEGFDGFVLEYLQKYPSRSYTLDRLGDRFPDFLSETRPAAEDGGDDWPRFLIDLATLEWTIAKIYDGPGPEGKEILTAEALQTFPPERFVEATLFPVASLQLLSFGYPVSAYFTTVRRAGENESVPLPDPMQEYVAILRRNFIVRRYSLTEAQYATLQSIRNGEQIRDAISAAAAIMNVDDDSLAAMLRTWFYDWSKAGFFAAIA